jgi:hypothetical protein
VNASTAALAAFRQQDLIPIEALGWDEYRARIGRYDFARMCYSNRQYENIANFAPTYKKDHELYKKIRGIYNPTARLIDLYVSKVYGGQLNMENASTGAIPIVQASDEFIEALIQLWRWSNWGTAKSLYVRNGALLGDTVIKIVDDRERGKVRMEVVDPAKVADVQIDDVGNVKDIWFAYPCQDEGTQQVYTKSEHITQETISTYKNNVPFAYYTDADGNPTAEWDNEYGFVPVVLSGHKDMGLTWKANAFHHAIGKIDELNDSASIVNDQIRKSVNVMWYATGTRGSSTLKTANNEHKDEVPIIYGDKDSTLTAMVANLDLTSALQNIQNMLEEVERDMPELALSRLRQQGGNLTAPGVRTAYSDAIGRITEARGNYDDALVRAQQMAVSIGGYNRYPGFLPFDLRSYELGDLDHYIAERPVIEDSLSQMERIGILQQIDGKPADRLILRELNIAEDEIDDILLEAENRARQEVRSFAQSVFKPEEDIIDGNSTEEIQAPQTRPALIAGQSNGSASEAEYQPNQ